METIKQRIIPKKLGIQLEPLQLLLLYDDEKTGGLRRRSMPLRRFTLTTDPRAKAEELRTRHLRHLENVPILTVAKLLHLVQETFLQTPISEAVRRVEAKFQLDKETDLNTVSDAHLRLQKDIMQVSFMANAVVRDDPDFVYDKQVVFNLPKISSGWDDEENEQENE